MIAIKMNGHANPTPEEGHDALYAVSHIPGFIFGYVDLKENRVISFHEDTHPQAPLAKTQSRVEVSVPGQN